jgi:DNA-binding winged helix-turn-helix (wHTH) protein
VPLEPKVFNLLRVLVENDGRLLQKDELIKEVWPDSFVEEGNLNRNIAILRKALVMNLPEALYRDRSQARLSICRRCEER